MKKGILLAIACIAAIGVYAQKDVQATSILNKVSANYHSYNSLKADFTIIIEDLSDNSKSDQSGTITISKDKYVLLMEGQEIISNGNDVWTYIKDINEVQISTAAGDYESISPVNFFTIYEKGFKYLFIGDLIYKGKSCYQIDLVPEDDSRTFFKVQLFIEKSTHLITGAKILDKGGIHFTYNINNFKSNVSLDNNLFEFNPAKYPDIEIIDLR